MRSVPTLVLLALASGCVAPLGPAADDEPATGTEDRLSFFHSAMTLVDAPEPNESVVRTGGFYESWAEGTDYPTWAADALGRHALVTAATVDLALRVTGPVVGSANFPDLMVYGGSGDAWMGFGSLTDYANAMTPGTIYQAQIELAMPPGGLWLAPDQGFGLKVVPVMYQQDDSADVEILLGGEEGSRVAWTIAPFDLAHSETTRDERAGEVVGTIYSPVQPPTTSQSTPVSLGDDVKFLLAWMNTTSNVGVPDIDLGLVHPDGSPVTTSGTPTPREAIRVAGPNIGPRGEYQLVVTTAGSPRAEYKLEWVVGR